MIYYLLILLLLIIIIIIYYYYNNDNNIIFMNSIETSLFLKNDNDNYIKNFNNLDIYARKIKSKEDYINLISNSTLNFNDNQINKLTKCAKYADKFLNNYENDYINGNIIAKIKWIFALTNNNYEEGMPHTRNNIIFLSTNNLNNDDDNLIRILIHEKIHIFQRYNDMKEIIKKMGYTFSRKKINIPNIRSNPDLDDAIYKDNNNIELIALYKSNKPNNINDVILSNFSIEHPYEKMAYDISEEYNKTLLNKYSEV